MTEKDYIRVTNLAMARVIEGILRGMHEDPSVPKLDKVRAIVQGWVDEGFAYVEGDQEDGT